MSLSKTAVDAATKAYWSDYYKDYGYGEMWVRDIPRRIRAALARKLDPKPGSRSASARKSATVVPLGYAVLADKGLKTDGLVRHAGKVHAFSAEFSVDGDLRRFEVL